MEMTAQNDRNNFIGTVLTYSSLGIEMGLCIAIGLGIGYYLDKYFTTSPYLTLVFMLFGIVAAFRAVYRVYKQGLKDNERDNDR